MPKKVLKGEVVSNKMQKTLVVRVEKLKTHLKYKKKYKYHKKYLAHVDNEKDYKIGDIVLIEESRPLSRRKRWKVIKKIEKL